jgi:hypothetical protein
MSVDLESLSRAIDDNSSAFVTETRREGEHGVVITLEFDDPRLESVRHACELHCAGVREDKVTPRWFESLSWLSEHPLLVDHVGPQASLYFSSRPKSAAEVILRAQIAVESATRGWTDPRKVLNGPLSKLAEHLNTGNGLLASGPLSVVEEIAREVGAQLDISIVRYPTRTSSFRVLLLDDAWIVCESVDVVVLPAPTTQHGAASLDAAVARETRAP